MAIAFFPPKQEQKGAKRSVKDEALRWVGCTVFGGTFSPFVIDGILPRYGLEVSASSVLATSAFMGMFAWAIVAIIPKLIAAIPRVIETYFASKK
jgi:hypothetical protein